MLKKILVAEDSPTVLEMVRQALENEGYVVLAAADGMEALNIARKKKPDLVILDLMLPKIDGYKVCAMLKFDERHREMPIIMFTARAGEADKKMGKEVRADAYLNKPFEPEALLSKIKELLERKG